MDLEDSEIEKLYQMVSKLHAENLANEGVRLPKLRKKLRDGTEKFTIDALVLVFLAKGYPDTRWVSKDELTQFIRKFYPNTNDVQSARHLGMQSGFYIVSSRRGNYLPKDKPPPNQSSYLLVTLETAHPAFARGRRELRADSFEAIKRKYNYRCATCGSEEGKPNLRYPAVYTQLQQAHRNPKLPLTEENSLPQCQFCNRADRNYWVYDSRGRVTGIASIKPIQKSIRKGYLDRHQLQLLYHYLREWLKKNQE